MLFERGTQKFAEIRRKAFRSNSSPEGTKEFRQGWSVAEPLQATTSKENPDGVTDNFMCPVTVLIKPNPLTNNIFRLFVIKKETQKMWGIFGVSFCL